MSLIRLIDAVNYASDVSVLLLLMFWISELMHKFHKLEFASTLASFCALTSFVLCFVLALLLENRTIDPKESEETR